MKKSFIILLSGIVLGTILFFIFNKNSDNNFRISQKEISNISANIQSPDLQNISTADNNLSIYQLTEEKRVVAFLRANGRLPDCYITKNEAQKLGWNAVEGNLCDVLPRRAIGGDRFGNREKLLPEKNGRQYFEADVNYNCYSRGTDRVIFSNDGLIFLTHNHYKSFEKQ